MGLGGPWGMCPRCQRYGQRLPGPPVHPLLPGVFISVSFYVGVCDSEQTLTELSDLYISISSLSE